MIGIDDRNQFDFYRDVPGIRELVAALQRARPPRLRRLQPVGRRHAPRAGRRRRGDRAARARARRRRRLPRHDEGGAAGPAGRGRRRRPGSRSRASRRCRSPGSATTTSRGRSGSPTARVPGVLRARWFEQRHMLHHTRRWNRDHSEELHSAWLNGVGVLVWENVFGAWVGWNERDKALLRAMLPVQRGYAELLATGEWTPLAAPAAACRRRSSPRAGRTARRRCGRSRTAATSRTRGRCRAELEVELPARGIAAVVGSEQVMVAPGGRERDVPGARPGARRGAGRAARRRSRRLRRGRPRRRRGSPPSSAAARPARTARRRTSRSGSRCRRGCTTSSR